MLGEAATDRARRPERYLPRRTSRRSTPSARRRSGRGIYEGPGISIKLSALHPRYCRAQSRPGDGRAATRACGRWPLLAKQYDIGLNIDAEEADRLELSLDLLERCASTRSWPAGTASASSIQAYQKRCPFVIDYVIDLARRSGHRLMVRLVKGAYWDSEIKRAQVDGLEGYPGLHPQGLHRRLLPGLRTQTAGGAGRDVTRSSPRTTPTPWRPSTIWPVRTTIPASTSSSACTAWASRCTSRWSAVEGKLDRPCRDLRTGRHP